MRRTTFIRLLLMPARLHFLCCAVALAGTVPLLWPDLGDEELQESIAAYAGIVIEGAFLTSLFVLLVSCTYLVLRLRNLRALGKMLLWALQWTLCFGVFCLFAIMANVPPRHERETAEPIQQTDTLFAPNEHLTGPSSLSIAIQPELAKSETLAEAPNLTKLEDEHEEILTRHLEISPRWAGAATDATFYARPGHTVARPVGTGAALGLVHVAFLTLIEGEHLPKGYEILTPGSAFPAQEPGHAHTLDIALELGHRHYLLLAWRGSDHGETARKAINATITAVDEQFADLAKTPTEECIVRMIEGKRRSAGKTAELRLSEVPTQYGTYQAEIYANPGKAGTLLLLIKDLESGKSLRLFNCPAQYSEREEEVFRHDIPGSIPAWMREATTSDVGNAFPPLCPIFAIKRGDTHQYFGVAFEVWFNPADSSDKRKLLLRRCYKVQPYEETPVAPEILEPTPEAILSEKGSASAEGKTPEFFPMPLPSGDSEEQADENDTPSSGGCSSADQQGTEGSAGH